MNSSIKGLSRARLLFAVLAMIVVLTPRSGLSREWVAFPSALISAPHAPMSGTTGRLQLRGQLFKPVGDGRYPAVVLLHDCRGIRPYQVGWADKLAGWGYVVLIIDSFMTRHDAAVCAHLPEYLEAGGEKDRLRDALGALDYLAAQPFVQPNRIAVMGWSFDTVLRAIQKTEGVNQQSRSFRAAIAISPACALAADRPLQAPALILIGERDQWTPAADCSRIAGDQKNSVDLVVYPNAQHGFDDPDLATPLMLADAWNPNAAGERGALLAYDVQAHADAITRVQDFLTLQIPSDWTPSYAIAPPRVGDRRAAWAVDPQVPGENLPAIGQSTFDHVFSTSRGVEPVFELPFPFEALTERLRELLPPDRSNVSALKQTLIPLGRSLQRHAAAPDYFRFPRVVLAIDGEPREASGSQMLLLKDRFYLGYQERTNIIEVISYNEFAGRFEFQLVKNYGPGMRPEVVYANRAVCTSCHQNGGPLFALFPWDETNGNKGVAQRLAEINSRFYGVLVEASSAPAPSIDSSTDRANLFPVYQRLWIEGCGLGSDPRAVGCRSRAFIAMLQYRLSGSLHFDRTSNEYKNDFFRPAHARWKQAWSHGLKVPNPDIRNREPVFAHPDIPAIFDPLNLRPPIAIWSADRPRDVEQVITGLSEFLPFLDLKRLDQHLVSKAVAGEVPTREYQSRCRVRRLGSTGVATRLEVDCSEAFELQGEFRFRNGKLQDGSIKRLVMPNGVVFLQIAVNRGALFSDASGEHAVLYPEQRGSGFSVRYPDGSSMQRLAVRMDTADASTDASRPGYGATVILTVADDFSVVTSAVHAMATATERTRDHPFAPLAFRGTRAMQALFNRLGLPATDWCCDQNRRLPPPRAEAELSDAGVAGLEDVRQSAGVRMFYRFCAGCHRSDNPVPPNFLKGDLATVEARIGRCAPRIFYRLSMWSLDPDRRAVTPMPPVPSLAAHGTDAVAFPGSAELAALKDHARRVYETSVAGDRADLLLDREYAKLRSCIEP